LFFLQRDRWRALTPADVDRVAGAYFKPANRTVGEFIPDARPDRSPTPPTVDIAAMVNGYKGDPAIAAGETFDATIKGREGEARLTGSMLMRGTSQHDRQQIADTLDRLRASLSISGGQTALAARGQTLRSNLAPTLDLLAEVLQQPSFPAAELETLKRAQTAGVEQERSDPRAIAVR